MDDKKKHAKKQEENEENIENVEQVDEEFESLKNLALQLEDNYKRAIADYQNLQRRTIEEKREWAKLSNKDLLLKLLPILDTLLLAEKHTKDQGITLSVQQFLQVLGQEGVTRIKTIGEEFNPHTMEAVSTTTGEKGKVVEEARAGFLYYDTVLRAAQVLVGA
ncbi:MAG: nucleotide exchange factor GrpE [Candidatus Levyibacteriota bacterium]